MFQIVLVKAQTGERNRARVNVQKCTQGSQPVRKLHTLFHDLLQALHAIVVFSQELDYHFLFSFDSKSDHIAEG